MGKAIDDEVLLALAKKGGGGGGGTDDYDDLAHKPQVNGHTLEGNKSTSDLGIKFEDLPDAPTIPNDLADLQDDSTHRTVTDTEKATWNGKSDFSGAYADLTGLPTLGTASAKDVPASGDASSNQVVMGNDTRLTDSRPASDVSSWAKQSTKPTYTASEVGAIAATEKGVASGVAELDANGKVLSSQLPSYVDDVVEGYYDAVTDRFYTESTFENVIPPESGKSWVDVASNKSYRWTGTVYSRVDEGVQLGETSGSAYRGDRGKIAYDHSQTTGNPHGTTATDVGLSNVPNVSTNDQTPTFTEASTRNNITSGEKLSVILGKIQKFFNDLKTVAFSGSFSDLSNKPSINSVTLQGNKTASDLGLAEETTEITWADWILLTPQEQESGDYTVINCPWADGEVDVDLMTELWENPNPTSAYSAGNITGISTLNDYDIVMMRFGYYKSASDTTFPDITVIVFKGRKSCAMATDASTTASRGANVYWRNVTFDDTNSRIVVDNGYYGYTGQERAVNNDYLIPHRIYGIKLTTSVKINAIAMDVSTSADKCMLSDGVTSVEDRLDDLSEGYKVISSVTANGVKTNATLINELFSGISIKKDDDIIIIQDGYYRFYLSMAGVDTRYKRFVYTDFTLGNTNHVYVKCIAYDSNSGNANTTFTTMDINTSDTSFTDNSATVPTSGKTFEMLKR